MGLLSDVYSYGDTLKRKINDLAKNPGAALEQFVGQLGDDTNTNISNMQTGYGFGGNQSVLTTPKQKAAAQRALADYGAQSGISAATVWHGSPHKFDKFDSSKIGTGEGAQAYGHGIYTAESPEVAMKYQPRDPRLESKIMQRYSAAERQQNYPAMQVFEDFGLNRTPEEVLSSINEAGYSAKDLKAALDAHKIASKEYASQSAGSLYKVDLPDEHIAKMLDWDKPLSQQHPDVQKALNGIETNFPEIPDFNLRKWMDADPLASTWHNVLQRDLGADPAMITGTLKDRGIPGIRYLDGGSRGAGSGSSNFVVFPGNEGLLSIMERNGSPIK